MAQATTGKNETETPDITVAESFCEKNDLVEEHGGQRDIRTGMHGTL